jgi:hypothetical protein
MARALCVPAAVCWMGRCWAGGSKHIAPFGMAGWGESSPLVLLRHGA